MLKKLKVKLGKKVENELPKIIQPLPETPKIEEKPIIGEIKVTTKKGKCSRCGNDFSHNTPKIKNGVEVCPICLAPTCWVS